jgi:hypothetical protein
MIRGLKWMLTRSFQIYTSDYVLTLDEIQGWRGS